MRRWPMGGGIAFEIDNHKVLASVQYLAQMIVAVVADACGIDAAVAQGLQAAIDIRLAIEQQGGLRLRHSRRQASARKSSNVAHG